MDGLEETFVENLLAISQSGSVIMEHYNKYEKKEIAFSEFKSIVFVQSEELINRKQKVIIEKKPIKNKVFMIFF